MPMPPVRAVIQSAIVTVTTDRCQLLSSNGGPIPGMVSGGPIQDSLASDTATMTASELPMPALASHSRRRARRCGA